MNKRFVFGLFLALTLTACEKDVAILKDPTNPTPSTTTNYTPLTVGSYWVYDWYAVDSSGNSTLLNITDSVYISADTIIGTDTYAIMEGTWFGFPPTRSFLRDSNGDLVNPGGGISFSATNYTDTLYHWNSGNGNETGYLKMDDIGEMVTVPAGTFRTLNAKYTVVNNVGTWPCFGKFDVHDNQYADNVGKVRSSFQFTSNPNCKVNEQRLRSYHIN